eukprot:6182753-Pleurochrysis_carterae.AAC.2
MKASLSCQSGSRGVELQRKDFNAPVQRRSYTSCRCTTAGQNTASTRGGIKESPSTIMGDSSDASEPSLDADVSAVP